MTNEEVIHVCDKCAIHTSAMLLQFLADSTSSQNITSCTFENLADWYTTGGYKTTTWLELLDLSKWLPLVLMNNMETQSYGAGQSGISTITILYSLS
jgi:hypothetical protein